VQDLGQAQAAAVGAYDAIVLRARQLAISTSSSPGGRGLRRRCAMRRARSSWAGATMPRRGGGPRGTGSRCSRRRSWRPHSICSRVWTISSAMLTSRAAARRPAARRSGRSSPRPPRRPAPTSGAHPPGRRGRAAPRSRRGEARGDADAAGGLGVVIVQRTTAQRGDRGAAEAGQREGGLAVRCARRGRRRDGVGGGRDGRGQADGRSRRPAGSKKSVPVVPAAS